MRNKTKTSLKKLTPSNNALLSNSTSALEESVVNHLEFSLAKDEHSANQRDLYKSLALAVRDRLVERWVETQHQYYARDAKRVYYLSLEYLPGRMLSNALINLDLADGMREALHELGLDLETLQEEEPDMGLGNGGLGRLAACFMDSLATLSIPAIGYGIRYEYGIFTQRIRDGRQIECPDSWLKFGNPWEIERPKFSYRVKFYGRVRQYTDKRGRLQTEWLDTDDVMAISYDTLIPGYKNNTVNHLRLWAARSDEEFNLDYFNHGDYGRAVWDKVESETISKVLYPRDDKMAGRELRLKQEYFFVSATLQDILRRYKKGHHDRFAALPDKVAIQLNDTHPAIAIAELMRLLVDEEGLDWERAWKITTAVFAYTNHTILPEALEKWRVSVLGHVLPRHLQIIYEINRRFLETVSDKYPGDNDRLRRMSIIEEGHDKWVRMAHLAIIGSHSVNGVAALHTKILQENLFADFAALWPDKFNNKTNGITQRRWLLACNPGLAELISSKIGDRWITELSELKKLEKFADDPKFQQQWQQVKQQNKMALARVIHQENGVLVNLDSMFDCQVKRIHEYKRQLLNALHVVALYNRIKANPTAGFVPRTVLFAGKAAPAYMLAKNIIQLIHAIADVVNNDPQVGDKLKVVFLANYSVSLAEKIMPAADLSEQISTAGMEASGTGNMKFALNGALTIGTLDGANVEIQEEVGDENIFIFGLRAEEVAGLRRSGYNPWVYYHNNPELQQVLDMIRDNYFCKNAPGSFQPIIDTLLHHGDHFMLLADFDEYLRRQEEVSAAYADRRRWTKMSILNVARIGKFSSDRTIREYAEKIWRIKPVPVQLPA